MKFLKRNKQPEFNDAITAESRDALLAAISVARDQLELDNEDIEQLFQKKISGEISDWDYNPQAEVLSLKIQNGRTRLELLQARHDRVINGLAASALSTLDDVDR